VFVQLASIDRVKRGMALFELISAQLMSEFLFLPLTKFP
jgi:hypothetical protein